MHSTKEKTFLAVGVGGQGVRTIDVLHGGDDMPCRLAVCDTDDRTLACSATRDRYLLTESSLLGRIVHGAETVIVTGVLGGVAGDEFLPAICSKARKYGAKVFAVVATSPRDEDRPAAEAALLKLRKDLHGALWVIDSQAFSQSLSPQPSQADMLALLRTVLGERILQLVRHRSVLENALEALPRLFKELNSGMET